MTADSHDTDDVTGGHLLTNPDGCRDGFHADDPPTIGDRDDRPVVDAAGKSDSAADRGPDPVTRSGRHVDASMPGPIDGGRWLETPNHRPRGQKEGGHEQKYRRHQGIPAPVRPRWRVVRGPVDSG